MGYSSPTEILNAAVSGDGSLRVSSEAAQSLKSKTFDGGIEAGALAAKAVLTTVLAGANNDMVFTADANGTAGNGVSVEYRAPGAGGQNLSVTMDGTKAIVVHLKTSAGVNATSILTGTNAANATAGKKVTIGTTVYTFQSVLAAVNDVKIAASADLTLANLVLAINGTGVAGTNYFAGTVAQPNVTAGAVNAHTITITAKLANTAGNAIATTTDEATYSWTSTVMAGGEGLCQILSLASEIKTAIEANGTAAALVDIANSGGDSGAGVVTVMAQSYLTGGSDGKVPLFSVEGGILCSLRGYIETDLAGANATLVHGVVGTTNMLIPILTSTTLDAKKGIDKSAAVVARGTALDKVPLWYVQDEEIFATTATAATAAGKIHYILDYIKLSDDAEVTPL